MPLDRILLAAMALGHLGLAIWVINVVHGLGLPERVTGRLMVGFVASFVAASAGLAWFAAGGPWPGWPGPVRAYAAACTVIALVGLPATTLARWLRRRPEGVTVRGREVDLASEGAERLIGAGRYAWMLRLPGNESLRLRRVEARVEVPGLPEACDGLSVVQVSDLHFARCYRRAFFEAVLDQAGRWDADLVAFTGDLIDDEACVAWIEPVLSRLRGRLGTFAILGNHDYAFDLGPLRHELARAGFADLEGRWGRVEVGGATVAVGGTSAPWGIPVDAATMPRADVRILLSHTPDQFERAAGLGIDLVLSGHNHGGQVRLPVVGPVLMPSRYSRRYDRGFFRRGRTLMYVSQGVGGKHPVRYGCTPEVTRLVLRSSPKFAGRSRRVGARGADRRTPMENVV